MLFHSQELRDIISRTPNRSTSAMSTGDVAGCFPAVAVNEGAVPVSMSRTTLFAIPTALQIIENCAIGFQISLRPPHAPTLNSVPTGHSQTLSGLRHAPASWSSRLSCEIGNGLRPRLGEVMSRCYASENPNPDAIFQRQHCKGRNPSCAIRQGVQQRSGEARLFHSCAATLAAGARCPTQNDRCPRICGCGNGKQSGRTGLTAMLAYLAKHHSICRTIVVEKTDRLYRNLKDWIRLDDLGISIHLVEESCVVPIRAPPISSCMG